MALTPNAVHILHTTATAAAISRMSVNPNLGRQGLPEDPGRRLQDYIFTMQDPQGLLRGLVYDLHRMVHVNSMVYGNGVRIKGGIAHRLDAEHIHFLFLSEKSDPSGIVYESIVMVIQPFKDGRPGFYNVFVLISVSPSNIAQTIGRIRRIFKTQYDLQVQELISLPFGINPNLLDPTFLRGCEFHAVQNLM